jgi:hypothetical protein
MHCGTNLLTGPDARVRMLDAAHARAGTAAAERDRAEVANWDAATKAGATFGVGGNTKTVVIVTALLVVGGIASVRTGVRARREFEAIIGRPLRPARRGPQR